MKRARAAETDTDTGALVAASPVTGESSEAIWRRWSLERAERERTERVAARAAEKTDTERGIYSVELARDVAQTHAQGACPEWRYLKDLVPREYGRILREQPEMRQRDVQAREQILVALFNGLPMHLRSALGELRTVMELVATARECTTFLLGFEIGREAGHRVAIRDPRVQLAPTCDRKRLAAPGPTTPGALRLHDGTSDTAEVR